MKGPCFAFDTAICTYVQLFRLTAFLRPNNFSISRFPDCFQLLQQISVAIAAELSVQEKTLKRNRFNKQLYNGRFKLIQVLDLLYNYRRQLGGAHPYASSYQQLCHLVKDLLVQLELMFGKEQVGKLKMEEEQLALLKPSFLVRLKRCELQMKREGLEKAWSDLYYQAMTASLSGENSQVLTQQRWAYLSGLAMRVEELLQAGCCTEEMLFRLLLQHNFNSEAFCTACEKYWQAKLEQQQETAARIRLLDYSRQELEAVTYSPQQILIPGRSSVKKQLRCWLGLRLNQYENRPEQALAEEGVTDSSQKRITLNVITVVFVCFCKILMQASFIAERELEPVLKIFSRFIRLRHSEMPSYDTLKRNAFQFTPAVVDQVIDLHLLCIKKARELKKELTAKGCK